MTKERIPAQLAAVFQEIDNALLCIAKGVPIGMFLVDMGDVSLGKQFVRIAGEGDVGVPVADTGFCVLDSMDDTKRRTTDDRPLCQRP